jgi:hypothetical protein
MRPRKLLAVTLSLLVASPWRVRRSPPGLQPSAVHTAAAAKLAPEVGPVSCYVLATAARCSRGRCARGWPTCSAARDSTRTEGTRSARVEPRTRLRLGLQADRSPAQYHAGEARRRRLRATNGSSYDPTSVTVSHAATAASAPQRRDNTQAEEPDRQCGYLDIPPRRVQHRHRTRVDQPVYCQRDQARSSRTRRAPALAYSRARTTQQPRPPRR